MNNDASILKQRVIVKRLTKTADGYGGWTSTKSTVGTYWCSVRETSGEIDAKNGIRLHEVKIDLVMRKPTSDLIQTEDILQVEGASAEYRLNSLFQTFENFWVKATLTKIGNEN
jgi:head-tail adaptor